MATENIIDHVITTEENIPKQDSRRKIPWGARHFGYGFVYLMISSVILSVIVLLLNWQKIVNSVTIASTEQDILNVLTEVFMQPWFIIASTVTMYLGWWMAMREASYGTGLKSLRKEFNITFKWKQDILIALVFTIGVRAVEILLSLLFDALNIDTSAANNSATVTSYEGIYFFIIAVLIAGIVGPIFEELFFRGLGLQGFNRTFERIKQKPNSKIRPFVKKHATTLAVILSSTIFGLIHYQGTSGFGEAYIISFTGTLGLILAIIKVKTGRMGAAICAHVLFNLSGVALSVLGS